MTTLWDLNRTARSYHTPHEEKIAAMRAIAELGTIEAMECLYNIASDGYMAPPYVNEARDLIKELDRRKKEERT